MVPPNYCGVYFDGFYPEEFGEWEFTMPTSIEKITTNAVIETVEGPCDAIMPGRFISFTIYLSISWLYDLEMSTYYL